MHFPQQLKTRHTYSFLYDNRSLSEFTIKSHHITEQCEIIDWHAPVAKLTTHPLSTLIWSDVITMAAITLRPTMLSTTVAANVLNFWWAAAAILSKCVAFSSSFTNWKRHEHRSVEKFYLNVQDGTKTRAFGAKYFTRQCSNTREV